MELFSVGARARGFIAIGGHAEGVIALGQVATGLVAVGQMATGVVAVGQLARGCFVLGQGAIGFIALGQGAVGVFSATGMLGIGGRAKGMLALSLWPAPLGPPAITDVVSLAALRAGEASEGWVAATFEPAEGGFEPRVVIDGAVQPDLPVSSALLAERPASAPTQGWLWIRRAEQVVAGAEQGFRDRAQTRTLLVADKIQWDERARPTLARWVIAVLGTLATTAAVLGLCVYPTLQSLIALAND
jgi:hypothetical protein